MGINYKTLKKKAMNEIDDEYTNEGNYDGYISDDEYDDKNKINYIVDESDNIEDDPYKCDNCGAIIKKKIKINSDSGNSLHDVAHNLMKGMMPEGKTVIKKTMIVGKKPMNMDDKIQSFLMKLN